MVRAEGEGRVKKLIKHHATLRINDHFCTILGQLEYALMLHDEYCDKTAPAYSEGKWPHPFTMLAEEKNSY